MSRRRRTPGRLARLRRALSDREDLQGATPTLEEDFHQPCPGCGAELVMRADQPIRRVRCGKCQKGYTLDRRIGGELCLIRYDSRASRDSRRAVEAFKTLWFRIGLLVLTGIGVSCALAMIALGPWLIPVVLMVVVAGFLRMVMEPADDTTPPWRRRRPKVSRRSGSRAGSRRATAPSRR